jgi:deoxycytidylate deaminase
MRGMAADRREPFRPELVIGLVGPIGSGLSSVVDVLRERLNPYRYTAEVIKISRTFRSMAGYEKLPTGPRTRAFYDAYMTAGDELRSSLKRLDAAVLLALPQISEVRKRRSGASRQPADGTVFVVDSLKTPEEVALLRAIYGNRTVILSAYASEDRRRAQLEHELADAAGSPDITRHSSEAVEIINRDYVEAAVNPNGQNVSQTFPLADYFLDCDRSDSIESEVSRFLRLLFAHPAESPNRDEYGMYLARASGLRSASMSRQVGVAIATVDGEVIALGCNEVPKAGGGQYWTGDMPDAREVALGFDSSESIKERVIRSTIKGLVDLGWRPPGATDLSTVKEIQELTEKGASALPRAGLPMYEPLEFYREVHAEMAAITDASRRGVAVNGCTLYTTTFPCHDCAKHIVAAGISRVVFVEPYPKSRAGEMYPDSIDMSGQRSDLVQFQTFVGTAPRRFSPFFRWVKRKEKVGGRRLSWSEDLAEPRIDHLDPQLKDRTLWRVLQEKESEAVIQREDAAVAELSSAISQMSGTRRQSQ